ncbi:hypothetical protein ACMD2_17815 [Ananas comosus]|uniref:Small ribosomal subunit protein eS31 domain-containing protein n=1 Tax=Ananas comosus TaxID=4615 RepID=A0A199UYP3_ANACO|nr:hypothetical protein ACMD2_17815 [Ananas comosus]
MANHFDRHYCGTCGITFIYQNKGLIDKLTVMAALFAAGCFCLLAEDFSCIILEFSALGTSTRDKCFAGVMIYGHVAIPFSNFFLGDIITSMSKIHHEEKENKKDFEENFMQQSTTVSYEIAILL